MQNCTLVQYLFISMWISLCLWLLFLFSFQCGSCRKTWPSARVIVLFRYRLRGDRGTVIMRPFGQACRRCQDEYDLPGFSQKEVEEALLRLFRKIRKNCYGDDDDDDGASSTSSTKVWTKPHEAGLCEACRMGICCQDDEWRETERERERYWHWWVKLLFDAPWHFDHVLFS